MREEFDKALKNLKNKKAAGIDGIQAELWKEAGEEVKNRLFQIIRDIYATGEMPEDYIKSIIIPIPKKAAAKKCEEFRTISLLSHASKILTKIIFQRIESKIEQSLTEDQFGFRKNRGTREAILALRIIIQKRIRKNKQTFIAFVDIEKAFDNVNWKLMFNIMTRVGIKHADRKLLYKLYKDELAVIKIQNNVEEAKINKGVRQGCTLSPIIFNAYIQEAIEKIKENTNLGIIVNGHKISMLSFADDIALIAETEEDLQQLIKTMDEIFIKDLRMKINVQKTKVLVCGRENVNRIQIKLRGNQTVKQVDEFAYLGSIISNDGRNNSEIIKRICQAKIAFNSKKTLLASRNISLKIRKNLLKTYV
jgi:hypothetical protein